MVDILTAYCVHRAMELRRKRGDHGKCRHCFWKTAVALGGCGVVVGGGGYSCHPAVSCEFFLSFLMTTMDVGLCFIIFSMGVLGSAGTAGLHHPLLMLPNGGSGN
jgi:hypothetical protein